jgi:hypothetical protein
MRKHIELGASADKLFIRIADKDVDAYAFLCSFDEYYEDVGKFVVAENKTPNDFVTLLARTNTVYSLPFFIRNGHFLHLPIQQAFNSLADAFAWREHPDEWRRNWGDICALGMVEIVLSVANLKLGFVEARKLSPEIRELAWAARNRVKH